MAVTGLLTEAAEKEVVKETKLRKANAEPGKVKTKPQTGAARAKQHRAERKMKETAAVMDQETGKLVDQEQTLAVVPLRKRSLETQSLSTESKRAPKRRKTETYTPAVEGGGLKVAIGLRVAIFQDEYAKTMLIEKGKKDVRKVIRQMLWKMPATAIRT